MNKQTEELLNKLMERADKAAQHWLKEREKDIEITIKAMLDKRMQEIVVKLLGFNNKWYDKDEWELDHCNGRAGNSAAGNWLRERAGKAVREWLDAQAGDLPPLPETAIRDVRKEYKSILARELERLVAQKAVSDAKKEVENFVWNKE